MMQLKLKLRFGTLISSMTLFNNECAEGQFEQKALCSCLKAWAVNDMFSLCSGNNIRRTYLHVLKSSFKSYQLQVDS